LSLSDTGEEARLTFERDKLLRSIVDATRGLPGAVAFHTFGSLVEGHGDGWSDLDVEIMTTDVELSRDCLFSILAKVRPMQLAWVIDSRPDHWSGSVVFQETSLFHKLDLGIWSIHDFDQSSMPQTSMLLWSQPAPQGMGRLELAEPPFLPQRESGQHVVLGHLLSIVRYVKARKRGNLAMCWRFASALADAVFAAMYRRTGSREPNHGRLGTREYQALDRQVPRIVSLELMSLLDFSSPAAMDRAVYLLMHELVDAFSEGSDPQYIPAPILGRFYAFARRELAIL